MCHLTHYMSISKTVIFLGEFFSCVLFYCSLKKQKLGLIYFIQIVPVTIYAFLKDVWFYLNVVKSKNTFLEDLMKSSCTKLCEDIFSHISQTGHFLPLKSKNSCISIYDVAKEIFEDKAIFRFGQHQDKILDIFSIIPKTQENCLV